MESRRCIIVDDIEIDRLTVLSYVKRFPFFEVVGVFGSSKDALNALMNERIDVAFFDIDMPHYSGIDLRKKALEIPACVFITSHTEYAVEGFELDAIDYIVKPLTFERFSQTAHRIDAYLELKAKAALFEATIGEGAIFIKEGHTKTKVNLTDILYLEALKNYTLIVTKEKKFRVLLNIGSLLKEPDFQTFVRIHRGFAVQKHFVTKIHALELELINGALVPIGRSYKEQVRLFL
ncbi:response regulator transcription factor [Flavobacterium sp. CYK-55]|uniref:LytR/AlgR family response regulator transcription factor n=1 Tax=Flavobacterium sp. CYK-55 TaxID=2835529 RepID=UPI001BCFA985|nr:LytTR family DNA-binding domain-containing protein [Flavobacterium sp. CYK-55]MBS7787165.1 response regulator transcription factor [Flavobacterium sp. CYK-55]